MLFQNCSPIGESVFSSSSSTDVAAPVFNSSLRCDPQLTPSSTDLRRLTKAEYINSLTDLLRRGGVTDVPALLGDSANLIPSDSIGYFSNMDDSLSQTHVSGYHSIATRVAQAIVANPTSLNAFLQGYGRCSDTSETCLRNTVAAFGLWTFRRPLTSAETTRYWSGFTGQGAEKVRQMIFVFLQSPQFLFHLEVTGAFTDSRQNALQLTSYEMAARLSYTFWETMPDEQLFSMAANQSLTTPSGIDAAITHIFSTANLAKVKSTFKNFYSEWLKTKNLAQFQFNPPTTKSTAFREGLNPNISDMIDEVDQMVDYYVWQDPSSFETLLTSNRSFARRSSVAQIYGVPTWSGQPQDVVELPAEQRAGLLTRALFLVSPNEETHPMHRSVFVRRQILCDTISSPPANLPPDALLPPDHDPSLTTRERYEQKTSGASCMGCHSVINPIGFSLEMFDGLGRYRTAEKVFEDDGTFTSLRINPVVQPRIVYNSLETANDPIHMNRMIASSGKADQCFVTQVWRFTHKRMETVNDHCGIQNLLNELRKPNGTMLDALKAVGKLQTIRYVGP